MEFVLQLGFVLLLVFLNGFFVASEFALVAVRKTRIDELVRKGNKTAKLVQKSITHLDTFISATQLGITLASLALGWIGEPAIAHYLEPLLNTIFPDTVSTISAHSIAVGIAFLIITFLHIVLGELAPKTIALERAEKTSLLIIAPLTLFTRIFKPFIWLLNGAGNLVLRLVGLATPPGHHTAHSEEEIKMILAQSAQEGALEKNEVEMVYSVFKLADTSVASVMIPKINIVAFEKHTPLSKILTITRAYTHSRFPVYDGSIDAIIGFVHIKDLYMHLISEYSTNPLRELYSFFKPRKTEKGLEQLKIVRKIPFVKETDRIDDVLVLLRQKGVHIAVVQNALKKTVGLVALEDMVEKLVGKISDEFDGTEKDSTPSFSPGPDSNNLD